MADLALQELNDDELIIKVKEDADSNAFMELVDRHSGIYLSMVAKYALPNNAKISRDDLIDEKDSYIYDAVMNFDPNRGAKFSTYLGNNTKWHCLNTCKKNNKRSYQSIDQMIEGNSSCFSETDSHHVPELIIESGINNLTNREVLAKVYEEIKNCPDERIKTIFSKRYSFKSGSKCLVPWREVASELGLSIQGVIDIHDRFLQQIKKKYELQ